MVQRHVADRGIKDERVLQAMREVPRHLFVPTLVAAKAYGPGALPIGAKQTISQPYIVARMIELARECAVKRTVSSRNLCCSVAKNSPAI